MRPPLRPSPDFRPCSYTYDLHQAPRQSWSPWITSPRTYRLPSLRLSTASTFNTAEITQTSCSSNFPHTNHPCTIRSIKVWHFKIYPLVLFICLVLCQSHFIYKHLQDRRIYRLCNSCIFFTDAKNKCLYHVKRHKYWHNTLRILIFPIWLL